MFALIKVVAVLFRIFAFVVLYLCIAILYLSVIAFIGLNLHSLFMLPVFVAAMLAIAITIGIFYMLIKKLYARRFIRRKLRAIEAGKLYYEMVYAYGVFVFILLNLAVVATNSELLNIVFGLTLLAIGFYILSYYTIKASIYGLKRAGLLPS